MNRYYDEKWRGEKFNDLTVIGFEHVKRGKTWCWNWICRCKCGMIKSVNPYRVINGNTKSCGCGKTDRIIKYNNTEKVIHGYARNGNKRNRLYTIWRGMKERCLNKNSHDYSNYGGRGISVCEEWKNSFESFKDWAMANGYTKDLSIDRINVNDGYCPDNCRWATMQEQQRNRQRTETYEYLGEKRSLAEISEMTGIYYHTIYNRIHYHGWDLDSALKYRDGRKRDYRDHKKQIKKNCGE